MNIKKKIAVAVVGALAFASITGIAAQAAPTVSYTTMYDTTNGVQVVNGLATVTIHTETSTVESVVLSGVGNLVQATAETHTTINVAPFSTIGSGAANAYQLTNSNEGAGTSTLVVYSGTLGTTTITVTPFVSGVAGTPVVKTITWTSTGTLAVSATNTTSYITAGSTVPTALNNNNSIVAPANLGSATANAVANILVTPKDGNGNLLNSEALTVVDSGAGLIGIGTSSANANMQGRAVTGAAGAYFINVYGDGAPGTATITISDGTTVLSTKTVVFSGTTAKYAVSNEFGTYRVGSNGADGVSTTQGSGIAVTVSDANGNAVTNGTVVYATSNNPTIATVSNSTTTTNGVAYFGVTGVSAGTATFTFGNMASSPTTTATDSINVGSSVASKVTLAFDNTTYLNGSVVKLILTAVDANGKPISDVPAFGFSYTNFLSADFVSSVALGGVSLAGSASPTFINGVATWNVYAPLSSGPFTVTGVTGTTSSLALSAQKVALSASAQVANPSADAAKAASDEVIIAAQAARDAANASNATSNAAQVAATQAATQASAALLAITALQAQVVSLLAKLSKLAAQIAKIAKAMGIK